MPTKKKSAAKRSSRKKPAAKKTSRKKSAAKKPAAKKSTAKKYSARSAFVVAPKSTLDFITETLPSFSVGKHGSTAIEATGGQIPYLFQVVQGTLPNGLVLTWGGILVGTATQTADTTIYVQLSDNNSDKVTQAFDLEVI